MRKMRIWQNLLMNLLYSISIVRLFQVPTEQKWTKFAQLEEEKSKIGFKETTPRPAVKMTWDSECSKTMTMAMMMTETNMRISVSLMTARLSASIASSPETNQMNSTKAAATTKKKTTKTPTTTKRTSLTRKTSTCTAQSSMYTAQSMIRPSKT